MALLAPHVFLGMTSIYSLKKFLERWHLNVKSSQVQGYIILFSTINHGHYIVYLVSINYQIDFRKTVMKYKQERVKCLADLWFVTHVLPYNLICVLWCPFVPYWTSLCKLSCESHLYGKGKMLSQSYCKCYVLSLPYFLSIPTEGTLGFKMRKAPLYPHVCCKKQLKIGSFSE